MRSRKARGARVAVAVRRSGDGRGRGRAAHLHRHRGDEDLVPARPRRAAAARRPGRNQQAAPHLRGEGQRHEHRAPQGSHAIQER